MAESALARRVVGLVRGVHGLRGFVRVEVLTDRPEERFAVGRHVYREGASEPLTIASSGPVPDGPGWRLRFRQIHDRTSADALRDTYLEADVGVRPEPATVSGDETSGDEAPDEVWWDEVIGVSVFALDGEALGTVADVYRAGASEVYSVEGGPRGPFDLPAVRDFIREFAPREGRIVVDAERLELPPAGARRRPRGRLTSRAARGTAAPDDGSPA